MTFVVPCSTIAQYHAYSSSNAHCCCFLSAMQRDSGSKWALQLRGERLCFLKVKQQATIINSEGVWTESQQRAKRESGNTTGCRNTLCCGSVGVGGLEEKSIWQLHVFKKCQETASNTNQLAAPAAGVLAELRQHRGKALAKGVALPCCASAAFEDSSVIIVQSLLWMQATINRWDYRQQLQQVSESSVTAAQGESSGNAHHSAMLCQCCVGRQAS